MMFMMEIFGKILMVENIIFFIEEGNYGLMLNVDWFQFFKYINYFVGVIYLLVLNLLREERFKRENIMLIGIIFDMKKELLINIFF